MGGELREGREEGEKGEGGERRGQEEGHGRKWREIWMEGKRGKFSARKSRAVPTREEGDKMWEGRGGRERSTLLIHPLYTTRKKHN